MNLYIIGNGFDLGHGLPTAYWDFRTYLENLYPEFLRAFEEHYYIYPGMINEEKKKLLWNELESNLANIDEDIIIENAVGIDMNLESGDVGIEDTLYYYFRDEYRYIEQLAKYLKQWVRTIRIRDVGKKTSQLINTKEDLYITFNYTAVLETVYKIPQNRIVHIHGSLRERDGEPILGHGNKGRIEKIQESKREAERIFDEKWSSICKVVEDYYRQTYKDVGRYAFKLIDLTEAETEKIHVIGHSIAGVDQLYFKNIESFSKGKANWNIYYHRYDEEQKLLDNLLNCGIDRDRIKMVHSNQFYDL
ncbi:MAG: bacteriophage abortive infection AbiH family protein [Eubacteriales bacterium]